MKVQIILDADAGFTWYVRLTEKLQGAGHHVMVALADRPTHWPVSLKLLLDLERMLARRRARSIALHTPLPSAALHTRFDGRPDLIFDLSSGPVDDSVPAIRLLFDGLPAPAAAVWAILEGRSPRLDLVGEGRILCSAFPANEEPGSLTAGLAASFARCVDLCLGEVGRRQNALPPCPEAGKAQATHGTSPADAALSSGSGMPHAGGREGLPSARDPREPARATEGDGSRFASAAFRFGTANLADKIQRRLMRMLTAPQHWRIGYRRLGGPSILETAAVPEAGYAWLPDDGKRYLADPFLIEHGGRTWLFFEEFPYATRTGIISACEIRPDGVAGPVRPVLETGSHLSYPYIFAQGGDIWMIPESSAARDVVLYRATAFPFRWQAERKLLDGIAVADATPVTHGGRLWLFASLMEAPDGSSWDALALFHAPDLFGEFTAHPLNPVLIDAAAARPAGRMYRQGGRLLRLAQDCRGRYGAATSVAVIDRLDPEGYAQTVTHRIAPPAAWNTAGLHTIDVGGGYEAIDVNSRQPPVS